MKRVTSLSRIFIIVVFLLVTAIGQYSCSRSDGPIVALSKGSGSEHYEQFKKWLSKYNPNVKFVDLYKLNLKDALNELKKCSGIVLTGGPDVDPGRYGKAWDSSKCDIDEKRDTLEFAVIKEAYSKKLPILAVCRGEQILNVAFGGSLIVDIPSEYDTLVKHQCPDPDKCFHKVAVIEGSLLNEITGVRFDMVNSNHHQAVDRLAKVFKADAYASDMLIEGYEWRDKKDKPFMLAVQWHPERLDSANKLSYPIGKRFIDEVLKYYKRSKKI